MQHGCGVSYLQVDVHLLLALRAKRMLQAGLSKESRLALQELAACWLNLYFNHFPCYHKWFAAISTALRVYVSYMLISGLEFKI